MSEETLNSRDREQIILRIYDAVLRPENYDLFMADWASHVELAIARLDELRITSGPSASHYSDPVIEDHFRHAFDMLERIGRDAIAPLPALSRKDSAPIVTLSREEGVTSHGDDARHIFEEPPDLENIATALDPESARRFQEMVAQLGRTNTAGSFSILALAEPSSFLPGGLIAAVTRHDGSTRHVLELRRLSLEWTDQIGSQLKETFKLTPSELALVKGLAVEGDLSRIAHRTGRSRHTLRVHLKSVFQKTRTNSQTELLRLVAALAMFVTSLPRTVPSVARTGTLLSEEIALDDGRCIPVQYAGPAEGRPIFFLHGMLDGLAALPFMEKHLIAHNLRLVAPIRNNFGPARPDRRVQEAPQTFARDIGSVIRHLRLSQVVLMGHMAGALYAFAAASHLGDRVAGIVNVSGGVPIRSVRQFAVMTPRQRTVAYTARFAPRLLPTILRAGIAQIDSKDRLRFLHALYPPGTPDRRLVADDALAGSILEGFRFSVQQGVEAFRTDSWHVTRDWSDVVSRSRCPVLLLHGRSDPVVSFDSVRRFAEESSRMELVPFDGGQLLLYAETEKIIARLRAFAEQRLDSVK